MHPKFFYLFFMACSFLLLQDCGDFKNNSDKVISAIESIKSIKTWTGTKQLGTSSDDRAYGVATDSSANVYVPGHTYAGLDGNSSAGGSDLFLVKYNSSGTKQ